MDTTYLSYTKLKHFMSKLKSYFTPQTRTVNKKALTSDVTVGTDDILYDGTLYGNDTSVTDLIDKLGQSTDSNTTAISLNTTSITANATNIAENSKSIEGLQDRVEELEGNPYELPVATSTELGGIKTGYADDGDTGYRFGVQLEEAPSNKAYVELPIDYEKGDYALMTKEQNDKLESLNLANGTLSVKKLKVTGGSSDSIMLGDGSNTQYYATLLSIMGLYCIDQNVDNGQSSLSTTAVTSDNVVEVVQDLLTALRSAGVLTD